MATEKEQWAEISVLFGELTFQSPVERSERIEKIQLTNPALAEELRSLIHAHESADGFFEEHVPRLFASLAPAQKLGLTAGERLLHFEILEFLGEGSQAEVYLARDTELDRLIALKVTLNQSGEARTLAHFHLDGIVQVFSEHVVEREGVLLRVICLQFIAGPTLAVLSQKMAQAGGRESFMQILEACSLRSAPLEPAALRWRERLNSANLIDAIVLVGMRLAEILEHTHARGIVHLDIKPANILLDPYGRPYLSDFNVSTALTGKSPQDLRRIGGTRPYMPPEQARLFENSSSGLPTTNLDARCDVYALGVLLKELLTNTKCEDPELQNILARATAPDRDQRTASAQTLAHELGAWLRLNLAQSEMPPLSRPLHWILSHPLGAVISVTVLSQIFASVINISYNHVQVVSALNLAQQKIFFNCVAIYNLISYPLLILGAAYALRALYQKPTDISRARRTALRVPKVLIFTVSLGWLPGAWIFPRAIDYFAGPVDPEVYRQFGASIWLGWLISMTTSLTLVLFVLVRAMYPKYWTGQSEVAEGELRHCDRLNRYLTFVAALIPMSGVLLMVWFAPTDYASAAYQCFKILLLITVGLGLFNLLFVQRITQKTEQIIAALKRPRPFT